MKYHDFLSETAHAKINLTLRIISKLFNGYHEIVSIVTFLPDLYDKVLIKKSKKLSIQTKGKFSKNLYKKGGDTLAREMALFLKKKYKIHDNFRIIIEKNIPLGSGLGGGSADAAAVARSIFKMYKIKTYKTELLNDFSKIGADIPICFYSCNQKVRGIGEKITKLKKLNKNIWAVLIKPRLNLNTKDIFKMLNTFSNKPTYEYNYTNLVNDMNFTANDLQAIAEKKSLLFSKLIRRLPKNKAITVPRMTGSGSTIFILFNSFFEAENYLKKVDKNTRNTWKTISRVIL